jgi:hypothetical protein
VLTLFLAVMAVATVLGAKDAFGCSCAFVEADEMVAGSEAAFEGTVISSEEVPDAEPEDAGPRPPGDVALRFKVERIFKGSLGEEITVRSSGDDGTCGLGRLEPGTRIALALYRDGEGRWRANTCLVFDADDLDDPGSPPPPPSLEPATLAQLARPSPVSAWRGIAVWSAYDEAGGAYRLMVADGDAVGPLPVDPSPVPFDADVGPDSSGDPAVAYSRCGGSPEPPTDRPAADCDLFILGLRDDRGERPIRNANSAGSEFNPTLWRGNVAWVRTYPGGAGEPFLYTRPLIAPRERRSERAPGVPDSAAGNLRVQELELYGRNLAVDSTYVVEGGAGIFVNELRLADVRDRSSRRVARVDGGLSGRDYVGLSMDAGRLGWYLTCKGDLGGCAANGGSFRHRISTGDYERAQDATELAGFGWTLGGSYRVTAQEPAVTRTGPLDWRAVDADSVR